MGLWMFYTDAPIDDIEKACAAGNDELRRRGFTAEQAQDAALAAADLDESHAEDVTPDSHAVVAWFAAEDVACKALHALTGEWPHQAALVWTADEAISGGTHGG